MLLQSDSEDNNTRFEIEESNEDSEINGW